MVAWKKKKLTLVGAGPGDPDLITRKGYQALQTADVVLYDALVAPELVAEACAKKIFVGKRAGQPGMSQSAINRLIVEMAYEYGHVVRLKGGDPFVFGRGYEEMVYARSHGVEVAIVPGLSSATSLAGLQGVSLTHRDLARSFWVLTATTSSDALSRDLQLAAQSSATLVILMGMRKLDLLSTLLAKAGKKDQPVMIVQSGTSCHERVLLTTVEKMAADARQHNLGAPGILVIGEVVGLAGAHAHTSALIDQVKNIWA